MTHARLIVAVLALLAVTLLAPAVRPLVAGEQKDQIDAFAEKMKSADEAGKVRLIEGLAASGNPGAAKAISKFMSNRSTAVATAALKAMGSLKDSKYLSKLMGMVKTTDKTPKILAAVVTAIGEYGDRKAQKTLVDVAKKWLPKNSDVASAAAKGLGNIPQKGCVEELIKLLDNTYPRQGQSGTNISSETRELLAASRPSIIASLQKLTGWDFADAEAWRRFWDKESRTWKPGAADRDLAKLMLWSDPGYGFSIERPAETWVWDRSEDYLSYRTFMVVKGENDLFLAFIYIMAYDAAGMTPAIKGEEFEDSYMGSWKDIKDASWIREDYKVGREKGYMHSFTGMDGNGSIATVKNVFVVKGGMMYIVGTWLRSGLDGDSPIPGEVEKALKSFKFTD